MTNTLPPSHARNQSIDTFRFLAAFAVIILHVEYPNVPNEIAIGIRLLSRWAIPFFFILSGYFLAANSTKSSQFNVLPIIERLIWVFLIWSFIYFFVVIEQHDFSTSIGRIFSPYFLYFGNFVHLWFLPSLIFGYIFLGFCYNTNLPSLLNIVSIVAVTTVLLSGSYANIDHGISLDPTAASVWLSIPFLYIGFLLYKKGYPAWWVSLLLIIFGAGLQVFEARFLYTKFGMSPYDHEFLIGTIPFGIGMASLALSDLKILRISILSSWGKNYSIGIYLIHPLVGFLLTKLILLFSNRLLTSSIWQLSTPLIVISISLAILSVLQKYLPFGYDILFGKKNHTNKTAS
jgi:surface polysaccharide O-acyltransferase-like enzyme